jgi:ribosomal protein S18 acetylase RimI-like enzyme
MAETATDLTIRPVDDLDIGQIVKIDEKLSGRYRPDEWERRLAYYIRRDPEAPCVAEADGRVVGFMLGEVRAGEFGLEEPTGWIEVLGVDPDFAGRAVGRRLADAMLEHFRARGAKTARTLVEEDMAGLVGFFESVGFTAASLKPFIKEL